MLNQAKIIEEVSGLYKIVTLNQFRRTEGTFFDSIPLQALPKIDAIDRVTHKSKAISPGATENVERPWYMHPHQEDNLVMLHGTRIIEIYTKEHAEIERFEISPNKIIRNGGLLYVGPVMLTWSRNVFHRIESLTEGSSAINFAVHFQGINIQSNFNIYELNTETGDFSLIREGFKDQQDYKPK